MVALSNHPLDPPNFKPGVASVDFTKFYDLESYLFTAVGPRFAKTGQIDPRDFYMILIWKSVRAKRKHWKRLAKEAGSFTDAVARIATSLNSSCDHMRRLEILMVEWKFQLPTATAILTVLYPSEFTVYDERVCGQLGGYKELASRHFSKKLWDQYQKFKEAVVLSTPDALCLRDKDRWLWGRSFYEDLEKDLQMPYMPSKGGRPEK